MNHNSPQSGFTLIELILVISIGIILSTFGFFSYSNYKNKKDIEFSLNEVSSVIKEIRDRSITQENGKAWGVRFNSSSTGVDSYEVFYGSGYSTSSVEDSWGFRRPVEFSEPSGGRSVDLTFEAITGEVSNREIISIVHKNNISKVGDIVINTLGKTTSRLENDIIGYWHFNEGTGTSTLDASGNENNGELKNDPTWAAALNCKAGECLNFDGNDDYVDFGDFSGKVISDPTGSITWGAWVNPNNHSGNGYIISSGSQTSSRGISMFIDSSEQINCWIRGSDFEAGTVSSSIGTGSFSHIVCVFDGDTGVITVYVNGLGSASSTKISSSNNDNYSDLTVGCPNNSKGNYIFDGLIDEVRIYDTALSSSVIKSIYEDLQ